MEENPSYREHFQSPARVLGYDSCEYGSSSYATLLWEFERQILDGFVDTLKANQRRSYLDFACGTGRIIQHLGPRFTRSVGVDISAEMLSVARIRAPSGEFFCLDVRRASDECDAQFDVITAFRFILNADPDDQITALAWLRRRLRAGSGRLFINNHGNLWSHKAVSCALRKLKGVDGARRVSGNVLSDRRARDLFTRSGFEVESVHGCGVLGGRVFGVLPFQIGSAIERRAFGSGVQRVGVNQLYVLRAVTGAADSGSPDLSP